MSNGSLPFSPWGPAPEEATPEVVVEYLRGQVRQAQSQAEITDVTIARMIQQLADAQQSRMYFKKLEARFLEAIEKLSRNEEP
jgi:hypothetical protein